MKTFKFTIEIDEIDVDAAVMELRDIFLKAPLNDADKIWRFIKPRVNTLEVEDTTVFEQEIQTRSPYDESGMVGQDE